MIDIKSLNKDLIIVEEPDSPDVIYTVVPNMCPKSLIPLDQIKLETYVRLKSLPLDLIRIVGAIAEGTALANKIAVLVPGLPLATPTHYPSGIIELQWKMDDLSVFGLMLSGYTAKLEETPEGLRVNKSIKISWRFNGPRQPAQHGEFGSIDETLEFIKTSFITRDNA